VLKDTGVELGVATGAGVGVAVGLGDCEGVGDGLGLAEPPLEVLGFVPCASLALICPINAGSA